MRIICMCMHDIMYSYKSHDRLVTGPRYSVTIDIRDRDRYMTAYSFGAQVNVERAINLCMFSIRHRTNRVI